MNGDDIKQEAIAMLEYRVTKYNPALRDATGAYLKDDWTAISDIGRSYDGVVLTREEYQRVEDAYVESAIAFMEESPVWKLTVQGLEIHKTPLDFREGDVLGLDRAAEVVRLLLREECWCRLKHPFAFIHVGYDFIMYVGIPRKCPGARKRAEELGLFVEDFHSPHHPEDSDAE